MARTKPGCRMSFGGSRPRPRSDKGYPYVPDLSQSSESESETVQSESESQSETPSRTTKRSRMSSEEAGAEVRTLAAPCVVHRKGKR